MSESNLWGELKSKIGRKWHASRIESHSTSSGFPDVDYCIDGTEGGLELKYSGDRNCPKIRTSQIKWHLKRHAAGGRSFILTKFGGTNRLPVYMIHKGKDVLLLSSRSTFDYWKNNAVSVWEAEIDIDSLMSILAYRPPVDAPDVSPTSSDVSSLASGDRPAMGVPGTRHGAGKEPD